MPDQDPLVIFTPSGKRGRFPAGTPILSAARQLGVDLDSVCGGRGICSRCQVEPGVGDFPKLGLHVVPGSLSEWNEVEARYDRVRGLAAGRRLGCQAQILADTVIDVPATSQVHKQVVRKAADATPEPAGATAADALTAPPDEAVTRPGDLWILGNHRLLCGDATNAADIGTHMPHCALRVYVMGARGIHASTAVRVDEEHVPRIFRLASGSRNALCSRHVSLAAQRVQLNKFPDLDWDALAGQPRLVDLQRRGLDDPRMGRALRDQGDTVRGRCPPGSGRPLPCRSMPSSTDRTTAAG
mgnify:CR=1 FL=1